MRRWTVLLVAALCAGCATTRPPGPPDGAERVLPWGAVAIGAGDTEGPDSLADNLEKGLDERIARLTAAGSQDGYAYRMLALSGGGSRGAFAAGFLTGWSETGRRPDFDVVTGISTGALMATFAFLGPDHDAGLATYREVTNADIFRAGNPLRALTAPSIHDTTPMRELIARTVTDEVIEAVAREHAEGRRLFVATTNLETGRFTVWDMTAIASSGRADRGEHYREILRAAAAFPVMFPPVYLPVTIDGEQYWETHVDGAARAAVFGRVFMLDIEDVVEEKRAEDRKVRGELYALFNSQPSRPVYEEVKPRGASIAERSVNTMLDGVGTFSAEALFRVAMWTDTDYYATWIPSRETVEGSPLDFDPEQMARLFELGRAIARSERPFFMHYPAPASAEELMRLVDPDESYDIDTDAHERAAGVL